MKKLNYKHIMVFLKKVDKRLWFLAFISITILIFFGLIGDLNNDNKFNNDITIICMNSLLNSIQINLITAPIIIIIIEILAEKQSKSIK